MKVEDVYNTLTKCLQKMNKILLALYLRRGHAGSATSKTNLFAATK